MGTRSLTVVFEPAAEGIDWQTKEPWSWPESEIAVMYRQYDGYISGHGHELAEFLANKRVVNGLGSDTTTVFNGMGCLMASVVAHFKTRAGDFYLHAAGTRDIGEEYIYEIRTVDGELDITVIAYDKVIFVGSPEALLAFNESFDDAETGV